MFHNHVQFTFSHSEKPIPQVRPVNIDVMCPGFQDTPQVDRDIIVSQVRRIRSESEAVVHADPVDDGFDDDYGNGFDLTQAMSMTRSRNPTDPVLTSVRP